MIVKQQERLSIRSSLDSLQSKYLSDSLTAVLIAMRNRCNLRNLRFHQVFMSRERDHQQPADIQYECEERNVPSGRRKGWRIKSTERNTLEQRPRHSLEPTTFLRIKT